jgi:CRP-like cAMP-binding protein
LVIRVMQAGDLAAVPTIFTRTPHIVTAEAVSEVNALKVEQGALVRIIEDHRAVMHAIVRYLSSLLRDAWEAGYSSSIRLGRERLAEQLVNRFQFLEGEPQGRRRQSLKISRTELAEITGLAKETVSRLLMELVRSQAIAVEGRSVRILDMAQLRRLAGSTR